MIKIKKLIIVVGIKILIIVIIIKTKRIIKIMKIEITTMTRNKDTKLPKMIQYVNLIKI